MQKCPNCGELTFGDFDQCFIGAATHKRCSSCSAKVSTPHNFKLILFSILMIFAVSSSIAFLPMPFNFILPICLIILTIYINWKYVPLIVKE